MTSQKELRRADFGYFLTLQSRWMDNDLYGHVNNVTYYSYFDTVVNYYLIHEGGLDIHNADVIGVVVESHCNYMAAVAYPQAIHCGLRVGKLGNSSVRYEVGIFADEQDTASAFGYFVHVFVERDTTKPVEIPGTIRTALDKLLLPA